MARSADQLSAARQERHVELRHQQFGAGERRQPCTHACKLKLVRTPQIQCNTHSWYVPMT
jgi:hypothetical protein